MNGCTCGWGGWGYDAGCVPPRAREQRLERLEEYQRDLEQRTADVADEIRRLKERAQSAS